MKVIGKERKEKSVKIVWQKKRNTPTLYGSIKESLKKGTPPYIHCSAAQGIHSPSMLHVY